MKNVLPIEANNSGIETSVWLKVSTSNPSIFLFFEAAKSRPTDLFLIFCIKKAP